MEKSDFTQISLTKRVSGTYIRCGALYLESSQQTNSERSSMFLKLSNLLSVSGVYIINLTGIMRSALYLESS